MSDNLKQGYPVKHFGKATKRYCQQLDLVDDAELIRQYKYWHSPDHTWSEIPEGIRAVGILEMEIYLHKNHAFMIVEVAADFDWDDAFARLASLNRQAEWEAFVEKFQQSTPGVSSTEKWQLMERIYALTECK